MFNGYEHLFTRAALPQVARAVYSLNGIVPSSVDPIRKECYE
jgi:hypothetical protein